MSTRIIFIALVFFVAILSVAVSSKENTMRNGEVIVQFDESLKSAAKEVMDIYPAVRAELGKTLGPAHDVIPVIRLVKDRDTFRRITDSDLIVALAVPRQGLIVIDYSRMNVNPFTLNVTLKHELCHLQLHQRIREENLPRWLDEGICQWVTGGIAEIMTDGSRSVLKEAVLSRRLIPISELSERFPREGKSLLLAYEESKSIVEYVNKEFGGTGILNMVGYLSAGDDPEQAAEKSLSISLHELESRWQASLARKTSWLAYISSYLYEVLFLFAAFITVLGFLKFLKRKRDYKDEDEVDEEEKDFRL